MIPFTTSYTAIFCEVTQDTKNSQVTMHPLTIRNNKDYMYQALTARTHHTQLFSWDLILNLLTTLIRMSFLLFLRTEETKTRKVRQSVQGHRAKWQARTWTQAHQMPKPVLLKWSPNHNLCQNQIPKTDFMFQFKLNWGEQKFIVLLKKYKKEIIEELLKGIKQWLL